jgi:hypothetical protein
MWLNSFLVPFSGVQKFFVPLNILPSHFPYVVIIGHLYFLVPFPGL